MGGKPKPAMRPSTAERIHRQRYEHIYLGERDDTPKAWTVEAYDHHGSIEQAIFYGPFAKVRAKRYMKSEYGK